MPASASSRMVSASSSASKRSLLDIRRGVNQVPQDGFVLNDARIVLHVGHARDAIGKLRQIGDPAGCFHLPAAAQFFTQGDQINGLLQLGERDHAAQKYGGFDREKVFGAEALHGGIQSVVIEKNGAEDGALGIKILGQRPC